MQFRGWSLTIISIIIVSWLFYRYLVPKTWKEWTRAGIVQAFIIAFYAEMYGFPLTIYFLTRFLGLDMELTEGNLWAHIFNTEIAHMIAMFLGYAIVLFGAVLVCDGWRRIYHGRRENKLVTDGSYAYVRHPQYTGLFLIVFGEGIVHWPTIISLIAFPVIITAYTFLARKEEREMLRQFGDAYQAYRKQVPMFTPRFKLRGI